MDDWKDILLRLLCAIYREWGGDCADLYGNPANAPTKVSDEYKLKGAPSFPDPQSKAKFLITLDDLESCLASPSNSLPAPDTATLTTMIAALRKDLGS